MITKWYPGHYEKIAKLDVFTSTGEINTSKLDLIFSELQNTPALRGIKYVTHWGWIENNSSRLPNTWDWAAIDAIVQRLYALRQIGINKRFMLAIDMETDSISQNALYELLPPDLVIPGTYVPTKPGYSSQLYAWPWGTTEPTGWYAKLWNTTVKSRFNTFIQAVANHIVPNTNGKTLEEGDFLCMVSTLESATSTPYDTYQGGSLANYQTGMFDLAKTIKLAFTSTPFTMGLNYSRAFIADVIPQLASLGIGINTPNGNYASGLNTTTGYPGILVYCQDPQYYNSVIVVTEVQGDDDKSTIGIDARVDPVNLYDFPSYRSIYERHKNVLHSHYMVWQRINKFWLGGPYSESIKGITPNPYIWPAPNDTVDSLLNFLQTDPDINANKHGSLNYIKPTNWI